MQHIKYCRPQSCGHGVARSVSLHAARCNLGYFHMQKKALSLAIYSTECNTSVIFGMCQGKGDNLQTNIKPPVLGALTHRIAYLDVVHVASLIVGGRVAPPVAGRSHVVVGIPGGTSVSTKREHSGSLEPWLFVYRALGSVLANTEFRLKMVTENNR